MTKNVHMTHVDESIFIGGTSLARESHKTLKDLVNSLSSEEKTGGLTVKLDGAPAVFCGYDPQDGEFFVGTKGVFNKTPKLAKTVQDCKDYYDGDLQKKMIASLQFLPSLFPKGYKKVLQGDLMFGPGDVKLETIQGEQYITCHPNTIKYAAPVRSELGSQWQTAQLGIVFHTYYTGSGALQDYKASFGFNAKELNSSSVVWFDDANVKNVHSPLKKTDALALSKKLRSMEKLLIPEVDQFFALQNSIPSTVVGARFATFWNSNIRKGKNPKRAYEEYERYVREYYEEKRIGKLKSDKAKESARNELEAMIRELKRSRKGLENAWAWALEMGKIKDKLMKVLEQMSSYKTFLQMSDGSFRVTKEEGYVAFGKDGGAVKLVDRFEFSFANFSDSVKKGWQGPGRS